MILEECIFLDLSEGESDRPISPLVGMLLKHWEAWIPLILVGRSSYLTTDDMEKVVVNPVKPISSKMRSYSMIFSRKMDISPKKIRSSSGEVSVPEWHHTFRVFDRVWPWFWWHHLIVSSLLRARCTHLFLWNGSSSISFSQKNIWEIIPIRSSSSTVERT